jgi:hypothetical protein
MRKAGLAALMHSIKHYDDGGAVANDTPTLQSTDPALLAQLNSVHDMSQIAYTNPELAKQLQGAGSVQDWLNIAQQGDTGGQGAGSFWSQAHTNVQDLLNQNTKTGQDYANVENAMAVNQARSRGENISDPQFQQAQQQYNALHGIGQGNNAAFNTAADYGNAVIAARDAKAPQYINPDLQKAYAGTQGGVFGAPGGGWYDTLKASGLVDVAPPTGFDNWNQVFEYQNYLGMTPQLDAKQPTAKEMAQEFYRPRSNYERGFESIRSQLPSTTTSPFGLEFASQNTPGYDPRNYGYGAPTLSANTDAYQTLDPLTASLNPQTFQRILEQNKQSNYIFQDPNITDQQKMDLVLGKAIAIPEYGKSLDSEGTYKQYTGAKVKYKK